MRKFKHILIFLLLITTTVVINGGTRGKCTLEVAKTSKETLEAMEVSFPDMISFANYINQ